MEIARLLAQRSYRTVLIARRHAILASLARELSPTAPSHALPLDLADTDAIPAAASRILHEFDAPSVLVNCAGFGSYTPFVDQPASEFDRILRVNFEAPVRLTRALLPAMAARRSPRPHVLCVASMSARMGPWGHAGYAASKAALKAFTESLHAEHPDVGFTVVYPGIVRTPYFTQATTRALWPRVAHRAIDPVRAARAAVDAIGSRRVAVYIPRHYRILDAIIALSPTLAARLVCRESSPLPVSDAAVAPPPLTSGT